MDVDISNMPKRNWPSCQGLQSSQINAEPNTDNKMKKTTDRPKALEESGYSIYKQLHIGSFGILLNISAYYGLINLQSSINIQESLGIIGLTVGYVSSVLWALFLTPVVIQHFGAKTALIISEMTYLIYCAANFYPSFYTLIPAAAILGFGEACSWASMSVLVTYYGEKYWKLKQLKQIETTFSITSYMTSSHNPRHANSVSTYGGRNSSLMTLQGDTAMAWVNRKKSEKEILADNAQKGKNAIMSRFFGRYFSIVKASQAIGNILSYVALGERSYLMSQRNQNMTDDIEYPHQNITDMSRCGIAECVVDMKNMSTPQFARYQVSSKLAVYLLFGGFTAMHITAMLVHYYLLEPIPSQKETTNIKPKQKVFQHMVSKQQLLISPISLYFGVFLSYCLSEFTRAFISCTMGVSNIGIVMIAFGIASMAASFLLGKIMPKTGANFLYFVAALIDVVNYIWTFKWAPTQDDSIPIYVMSATLGFNAGLWEPLINSTYAKYFPHNTATAFSLWNFWAACGIFIGFALSATVCLMLKLFVLIGALILGMVCYVCAEYRFQNNQESDKVEI